MAKQTSITNIQTRDDALIITATGEITHIKSPEFREMILTQVATRPAKMIVDLTGVDYMDSSGVAILVETFKAMGDKGGKLVLCGMNPRVYGIFEISKLTSFFTMTDDLDAALAA